MDRLPDRRLHEPLRREAALELPQRVVATAHAAPEVQRVVGVLAPPVREAEERGSETFGMEAYRS